MTTFSNLSNHQIETIIGTLELPEWFTTLDIHNKWMKGTMYRNKNRIVVTIRPWFHPNYHGRQMNRALNEMIERGTLVERYISESRTDGSITVTQYKYT